jgi:hypothetical protein
MTFTFNALMLQPLVALLAGILILIVPRILNFIVAIYLIFVGVTGVMASPSIRRSALKGATGSHAAFHASVMSAAGAAPCISTTALPRRCRSRIRTLDDARAT